MECASSLSCERLSFCRLLLLLPLLLTRCLLLGDGCASRAFARARVRVRALSAYGQAATMPQTAICADVHQTLDVHLNTLAEVAFDFALGFQDRANATELFFAQVTHARVETDLRLVQNRR